MSAVEQPWFAPAGSAPRIEILGGPALPVISREAYEKLVIRRTTILMRRASEDWMSAMVAVPKTITPRNVAALRKRLPVQARFGVVRSGPHLRVWLRFSFEGYPPIMLAAARVRAGMTKRKVSRRG